MILSLENKNGDVTDKPWGNDFTTKLKVANKAKILWIWKCFVRVFVGLDLVISQMWCPKNVITFTFQGRALLRGIIMLNPKHSSITSNNKSILKVGNGKRLPQHVWKPLVVSNINCHFQNLLKFASIWDMTTFGGLQNGNLLKKVKVSSLYTDHWFQHTMSNCCERITITSQLWIITGHYMKIWWEKPANYSKISQSLNEPPRLRLLIGDGTQGNLHTLFKDGKNGGKKRYMIHTEGLTEATLMCQK